MSAALSSRGAARRLARLRRLAVLGLLASVALACPSRPRVLIYDLAARAEVAELLSPREVLRFGAPAAEPHLADGFFQETAGGLSAAFVWSRIDCELSFTWPEPAARAALVDLAPFAGLSGQTAQVLLNGQAVGSLSVDARRRQRIELPAAAQHAGDNRVKFVFSRSASPADRDAKSTDTRQLAAAFYTMVVSRADDPLLIDLLARDAPELLSTSAPGGVPELTQVGTSTLRFTLRLPDHSELRFTPDLHRAARSAAASVRLRVTTDDGKSGEREIWARTLSARDAKPVEITVPLTGGRPELLRLALHVDGVSSDRFAWATWGAPRVLARERFDPLAPAPFTEGERRLGDALRDGAGKPNVVFIILDAGRAAEFGCYGYKRATTPHIDEIAHEGVLFENAYTPAVYTLGAMSSVWTSQYPDRHHSAVSFAAKLPKDRLVLAELLSAQGVYTAGFVANAVAGRFSGFDRGFSEFHEVYRDQGTSSASAFAQVLPQWFAAHRDQRFFAYVHFREPHFPYDPPPPFDTKFGPDAPLSKTDRRDQAFMNAINQEHRVPSAEEVAHIVRLFDGNVAFADQEIGRLRDTLVHEGLWDRTVVVIAADHGEGLFEHGWIGHNVQLFDESMHVPLIVHFPKGKGPAALRVSGFVDLLDVAPTIADLFGVLGKGGSTESFEGRSLLPVISGAPGKPAALSRTVWDRPRYALRTESQKFLYDTRSGEESLFDLIADPKEAHDRAKDDPLTAAYYRETLHMTIARLARRGAGGAAPDKMTREECENLRALGYITTDCQ